MRIMIAGGGTGGHVYPGIAMYDALRRRVRNVEVLFVGARAGVESRIFDDLGLPSVLLPGRGVRGKGLLAKLISPLTLVAGLYHGVREVLSFKPDVVIGTGGYASVAVVAASIICNRKRVVQEQNSVPGMANRVLSRFANLVLLSYEESRKYIRRGVPTAVVGNPIRVKQKPNRSEAMTFFDLDPGVPVVLICGGSRGARSINEASVDAIKRLLERRHIQFIVLSGDLDYNTVRAGLDGYEERVRVYPFLQEMHHAYSAADLAVSRSGASAVFELAAFGVPTVFVPYPYAADNHQKKNVAELGASGAAVVIEDRSCTGEQLETIIETLLDDEEQRGNMRRKTSAWAKADADSLAAEKILDLAPYYRTCVMAGVSFGSGGIEEAAGSAGGRAHCTTGPAGGPGRN
ncbi:MAG: undecaprenyldiphospho-muramoylpentapeptide beta-N-acetylglucosaminyltransferase [Candidatus Latescibacterota bacterium]|nr:MAG: undecaprenyldiphospho-muramoylpentapeptide beta-N-acetylglucosaminyltransferase [Candidatus Latescibacterota bacterium]